MSDEVVDAAFREHRAQAVAALTGAVGDLDLVEEPVQEAFTRAAER
jgi:predicted RNA polymerase sigma factor